MLSLFSHFKRIAILFNFSALGSVECYNPQTDNWYFVTPLSSARSCSTAAALRGKIYVVGGLGENVHNTPSSINVLNTVEVFDPTENR